MILIESNFIKENYSLARSEVKEDKFFYLPYTTLINVGLVLFGLLLNVSTNSIYSWAILLGMSIGFVGDLNNVSINESKRTFAIGSLLFIISYLFYVLALINSGGGILFLDLAIFGALLLLYLFCLRSADKLPVFQEFGKYKVITTLYPFVLIFLMSRAIINLFVGTLPILNVGLITLGVILIFITDMEFSMDKFVRPLDKMIGPILYPIGQLCIALSTILLV
ncbi:MAG: lysoplasmalogenase family protein [Candidatus Kariarchaeaceae archaeon]|jgi:hypothetical protein